jgi:hypothetical protein
MKNIITFFSFLGFILTGFNLFSQTTINLTGTSWVVPCGVTSVTVQMWGGGGGGKGDGATTGNAGGGGGSGGFVSRTITVTAGTTFTIAVGTGGAGGNNGANGANGTASTFVNAGLGINMSAGGGSGSTSDAGGGGGTASGGTTNTAGATGLASTGNTGGNGGTNTATGSGAGGNGGASNTTGSVGAAPGGGGGGGGQRTGGSTTGGNGGAGRITVTYTLPSAGPDQSTACITSATLAGTLPAYGTGTWTCITNCAGVTITSPTLNNSTVTGLVPGVSTTFRWTVSGTGCATTTDDVVITSTATSLCPAYSVGCAAPVNLDGAGYISSVSVGGVSSSSGFSTNGVSFAGTGNCVDFISGSTYSVNIGITSPVGSTNSVGVYIDWNADGDFADAGEANIIETNISSTNLSATGSITVPASTAIACGATIRMRVIYKYSSAINATDVQCRDMSSGYGEVEDYCINIVCCTPNAALCDNGVIDCGEDGIDCGGVCATTCSSTNTCENGDLDGDETGVDCGGIDCPPCGTVTECAYDFVFTQTGLPADGRIDLTGGGTSTVTTCLTYKYSNAGSNWVHGTYMNSALGLTSVTATATAPPAPISTMGVTYTWTFGSTSFTSNTGSNILSRPGYYVETAGTYYPGNNLGYPRAANNNIGPFCFANVLSCSGPGAGPGENNGTLSYGVTSDSYSGSWTNTSCQIQNVAAYTYTLVCPVVLPVELLYFKATKQNKHVELLWETASERDVDHYYIEKSLDGYVYTYLGQVDGPEGGNSSQNNKYTILDNEVFTDKVYYKLVEVDMNGKRNELTITALFNLVWFGDFTIVPNPVKNKAEINFNSPAKEESVINVYDMLGKLVFTDKINVLTGNNNYILDTEEYINGLYTIEMYNSFDVKRFRFVKEN